MGNDRTDKRRLARTLARAVLRILGWQIEGTAPTIAKYVLIGAPHTSNWDFIIALLAKGALDLRFRWIGKDTLFHWPFGGFMRWLGGIPVNRRSHNNFIDQMVEQFRTHDELVIVITPEGTRKRTESWKSGFYYIARGAQVPIVLGFVDYGRKRLGIGPAVMPSGDLELDLAPIRSFYADKSGKHPEQKGEVRIFPRD